MAIFRRDEPDTGRQAPPSNPSRGARAEGHPTPAGAVTVIAAGTRVEGSIAGATEVRIEGVLQGKASVEGTFVIASRGEVRGDVGAQVVRIAGSLWGNITASERVELLATGRVEGDIHAPRVSIAEGGFCQGRIEMTRSGPAGAGEAAREAAVRATDAMPAPRQSAIEGTRTH